MDDRIADRVRSIDGWLLDDAVQALEAMAAIQARRARPTRAVEVGVWRGKSLVVLSHLYSEVAGIDPLIHCADRDDQRRVLTENLKELAGPATLSFIEKLSSDLLPEDLPFPFGEVDLVHIDGDHTLEGALFDLRLSTELSAPDGIVVLDDAFNASVPGVTEAFVRHSGEVDGLAPVLFMGNKLFAARSSESAGNYRVALESWATERPHVDCWRRMLNYRVEMTSLGVPVEFCGQQLLVA